MQSASCETTGSAYSSGAVLHGAIASRSTPNYRPSFYSLFLATRRGISQRGTIIRLSGCARNHTTTINMRSQRCFPNKCDCFPLSRLIMFLMIDDLLWCVRLELESLSLSGSFSPDSLQALWICLLRDLLSLSIERATYTGVVVSALPEKERPILGPTSRKHLHVNVVLRMIF